MKPRNVHVRQKRLCLYNINNEILLLEFPALRSVVQRQLIENLMDKTTSLYNNDHLTLEADAKPFQDRPQGDSRLKPYYRNNCPPISMAESNPYMEH